MRLTPLLWLTAIVGAFGCAGTNSASVPIQTRDEGYEKLASFGRAQAKPRTSPQYLYVLTERVVSRYPIVDGVLSSQLASSLNVPEGSGQMAVSGDGAIYVNYLEQLSRHKSQPRVSVYAPGASGNDPPIRTILASKQHDIFDFASRIAVDQAGYLYWRVGGYPPEVNVFAPTASGNAKPIQSIPDFGSFLYVDPVGSLYVSNDNSGVDVWTSPTTAPTLARHFCLTEEATGVAANVSGQVFVAVIPRIKPRHHPPGIVEFDPSGPDCPSKIKTFATSPPFTQAYSMAEAGGQLFLDVGNAIDEIPETGPNPRILTATLRGVSAYGSIAVGP